MQSLRRKSPDIFTIQDQAFALGRGTLKLAAEPGNDAPLLPTAVENAKFHSSHAAPRKSSSSGR